MYLYCKKSYLLQRYFYFYNQYIYFYREVYSRLYCCLSLLLLSWLYVWFVLKAVYTSVGNGFSLFVMLISADGYFLDSIVKIQRRGITPKKVVSFMFLKEFRNKVFFWVNYYLVLKVGFFILNY